MSESAKRNVPATYADLLKLPDTVVGEIIEGELFVSPRPSLPHGIAELGLGAELHRPFQSGKGGPGGWWILPEPELHLKADILVPDLAGWKKERMPEKPKTAHSEIVPDWVCEVLSPSNLRLDRVKKVPKYAEHGVKHLWLLDPEQKTLEVMRLQGGYWLLVKVFEGGEKVRAEPFDAVEIDLAVVWGDTPVPAPSVQSE